MKLGALRLTLAAACALGPQLLRLLDAPDADDTVTRAATRVLATRYLAQGLLSLVRPASRLRRIAPVVELTHAVSMLPVALVSRRHRHSALCSAAAAVIVGILDLRSPVPSRGRRPPSSRR